MSGLRIMIAGMVGLALLAAGTALGRPAAAGWTTYRISSAGVALDLPSTWHPAAYEKYTPQDGSVMADKYPGMTAMAKIALQNKLVKFFAFAGGGEPVDIAVLRFSSGQLKTNGLLAQISSALIQSGISRKAIHEQTVVLPAGDAVRITMPLTVFNLHLLATEYVLVRNGSAIEITYTAPTAQLGRYDPIFVQSAQSVRYL
jgi:hypothetical protein